MTQVAGLTVVRRGRVRRAKLYYLRGRTGKAARIVERTTYREASLPEWPDRQGRMSCRQTTGENHVGSKTLFDVPDAHQHQQGDGTCLIYIDRTRLK